MRDGLWMLAGCFTWTFIEYGMHHWNGHLMKGKTLFSKEHLAHHSKKDYFSPLHRKLAYSVAVAAVLWSLGALLLGVKTGTLFSGGTFLGYVIYEFIHWSNHVHAPKTAYGRWARRHHFSHHFSDARYNHGVTTPLWDMVFRTYRRPGQIVVPNRFQMDWLIDPATADIRAEFKNSYQLRRPPSAKLSVRVVKDSDLNLKVGTHVVVEPA